MTDRNPFLGERKETKMLFSLVQKTGPVVKTELIVASGLTLSTMNRVLQPLDDKNIICDIGETVSSGGRKPHLFDVNKTSPLFVGIEISRLFVRVAIVNLKIEIVTSKKVDIDDKMSPDDVLDLAKNTIYDLIKEIGINKKELIAIGVGAVGKLDRKNNIIIKAPDFPETWHDVHVGEVFESEFDCPVYLDNGANAAIVAEYLFGSGRESEHMAYFHIGTGIRTGVINSHKLIRAINGKDDAVAHMIVDINGRECSCGNNGCVEAAASVQAIENKFREEIANGRKTSITTPVDEVRFEEICEAAENNDELAVEIIKEAGVYFGTGLANYISLMNPNTVILSGPLVSHSALFFKVCTDVAMKKCFVDEGDELVFRRGCRYKENVITAGIVAMIIETWLESDLLT